MEEDGYQGVCWVRGDEDEIAAEVELRGYFQPIDGRYHWYGRLTAQQEISDLIGSRRKEVVLHTPEGDAIATLSEPDPWSRYRVTGVGRPPFHIETEPEDAGLARSRSHPAPRETRLDQLTPKPTRGDSAGPIST